MKQEKQFETESQQLLDLMINSIYSEKEIFLRELLSNASDANDKYRYMSLTKGDKFPTKEHLIRIEADEKKRTISIIDNGIGMSLEDIEKNLGTIAKSGSKEFLAKMKKAKKGEEVSIIGQFGVGFYSAFMVADWVEVLTKPYGGKAHRFYSEGKSTYTVEDAEFDQDSGTRVTIHLKKDKGDLNYSDYLQTWRIKNLVKKYSDYIRYPIKMVVKVSKPDLDAENKPIEGKYHDEFEDQTLNSMIPLWKKSVNDVKPEDLNEFYKSKFNDYEDPLISLNVHAEGLYSYEALLFIPSHVPYDFYSENYEQGLSLYSHGIFIQDHYKDLVPSHLRFVKGLVDSDDFPLNVSREMLQKTPEMTKIAKNIESKVLAELRKTKKNDEEKYLKFFEMFGEHLKYGIYMTYGANKGDLQDLLLFHHLNDDKYITLEDYVKNMKKDQKSIYFAAGRTLDEIKALPQLEQKRADGIDVLLLDKRIDEFCVMAIAEYEKKPFKDVSSESESEISNEKREELDRLASDHKRILDNLKQGLTGKVDDVVFSAKLVDSPVCLTTKEGISMNAERVFNEEPGAPSDVKSTKVLEINPDHDLFKALCEVSSDEEVAGYGSLLYDEAMLLQGFEIEDKAGFVKKLNTLLVKAWKA
ncbi:MAG: molecular chaperone HtpG [Bacilli bacterium]|nr:molecular chaperone HtpG [Bacilli bacterium]